MKMEGKNWWLRSTLKNPEKYISTFKAYRQEAAANDPIDGHQRMRSMSNGDWLSKAFRANRWLKSSTPYAVCALAIFWGGLMCCAAARPAYAQEANEWTPRKFLETVKYIADNVDIEDDATVARLLRIELQSRERPSPGKDLVLKSQQVDYLSDVSFRVSRPIEEEGGRKRAYMRISLKPEKFCVQLEDAHAVLGENYRVPRPRQIDFWTPSGAVDGEAIANELNARDGRFDSIEYRPSILHQGVAIVFFFRRCAREFWIARVLPGSK